MTIKLDVLGYRYDDEEPAFQEVEGGFYYRLRHPKKLHEKVSFDAWMAAEGLSFGTNELGYASIQYVLDHEDMLRSYVPPAGSAQMNVEITKVPAGVDSTGEITVTGGPTDEPLILRISTMDSTSLVQTDAIVYVAMQLEESATEVAVRIAAAAYDPNLLSVANVAGVVTFTPSAGGEFAVFTHDTDRPY